MPKKSTKVKMKSFGDLFGNTEIMDNGSTPAEVKEIPLTQLHTFKNHPYKVRSDEELQEMVDSIKEHGVIVPGIVRMRPQGGYEIIAGHTRKRASELAGLETMPMYIKNLSDDEAVVVMVDSNIQRENILPSERAKAYKMKYDAMKHQGAKGNSLKELEEASGDNAKQIQRYIWLARLNDELLEMVDTKKLGFTQGVDISFMADFEQEWVLDVINDLSVNISTAQSAELKALSKDNKLEDEGVIREVLAPETKLKPRKVTLRKEKLDAYFPDNYTEEDIEEVIIGLLDEWKARGESE